MLLLKLKLKRPLSLIALGLIALIVQTSFGQGGVPPAFDVGTVRLSSIANRDTGFPSLSAGRFTASNVTVESLIGFAYEIPWSLNSSRELFNPRSPEPAGWTGLGEFGSV